MRTHRSSHNSRSALAALGLVAAVVAAAAGGQPSASSAAPEADAPSIRDVDFGEVAVPGTVCSEGLRFGQPSKIPVERGRSPVLDITRLTRVTVDDDVAFGDLDGDGADEAAVQVTCAFGANGAEDSVQVWALGPHGDPVVLASVGEAPPSVTGALPGSVTEVDAAGGTLDVTWTRYGPADPNCCPSQQATVTYEWSDGELTATGDPIIAPAESATTAD